MSNNTIFMQVTDVEGNSEGISGNVSHDGYDKWIALSSMTQGVYSPVTISNNDKQVNVGAVNFNAVNLSKDTDIASTALMSCVAQGTKCGTISIVIITTTGDKTVEMLRFDYKDCYFNGYTVSGFDGSSVPREEVSFIFSTIQMTTNSVSSEKGEATKQGPVGWDVNKNTKL